ncbi:5258_t:CDS:2 [Paraglomus occultum]|uniref:Ubiquinone biosynthesis O-methyltransferase, mitochondrial n=1 Tax=Paraglomus occultum TaxID=144539 RepID=A0A9N8VF02_9GLOM|nr:5258_t:CDS:2 [Paraglomus occultum]
MIRKIGVRTIFSRYLTGPKLHSTINQAEIAKFSDLSAHWWSPSGPFALLHRMNPIRVDYIRRHLAEYRSCEEGGSLQKRHKLPFEGLKILDVGSGGGLLSESLARLGANVVGIDASNENVQVAKFHAKKDPRLISGPGRVEYRCMTAEELLETEKNAFDAVCTMETIEHVDHPADFLKACCGLVKPTGHLFISTISRTLLSYTLTILLAEKVLNIVPLGTHDFHKYVRPEEVSLALDEIREDEDTNGMVNKTRWVVVDTTGVGYNPIMGKWFEINRKFPWAMEVNYFLCASRVEVH